MSDILEVLVLGNNLDIIIYEPSDFLVVEIDDSIDLAFLGNSNFSWSEAEIIKITNNVRKKNGLGLLTRNEELCRSALLHTLDMAENHFISHTGTDGSSLKDRVNRIGYNAYRMIGENLAMGFSDASMVVDGWMNSPGHRANILKREFNEIGVAYIEGDIPTSDGSGYVKGGYWTQHFGYRKKNLYNLRGCFESIIK
jgi:uncharacterized protein YkwD